jgi:hypothetical protein
VRVEPGEVEHALERHPSVREAAVVARAGPEGTELVGFVVPAGEPVAADALRAHLRTLLPDQMVPAHLSHLDELPRLPNGKTDRAALALRAEAGPPESGAPREAPRDDAERLVAEVVGEVLGVADVGAFDDFFSLGGHSLLATRLASALGARLGVEVPLGHVFQHPVVSELARALAELVVRDMRDDRGA